LIKSSNLTDMVRDLKPGVIAIHNLPKGFDEAPLIKYLNQFGRVLKLRISRSRKTGKSRSYAFVEFECHDVAKIVAETMNNYLMFERLIKCDYIPESKVHKDMFKDWNVKPILSVARHKSLHNAFKTEEKTRLLTKKRLRIIRKVERKLKDVGIDFECVVVNNPQSNADEGASQGRIVVDSSDEDIVIKTPPTAVKVKKQKTKMKSTPVSILKTTPGKTPESTRKSVRIAEPTKNETPKAKSPKLTKFSPRVTRSKTPKK